MKPCRIMDCLYGKSPLNFGVDSTRNGRMTAILYFCCIIRERWPWLQYGFFKCALWCMLHSNANHLDVCKKTTITPLNSSVDHLHQPTHPCTWYVQLSTVQLMTTYLMLV